MEIVKQITTTLYLVIVACVGKTLGNTVSLPSASGYVGESLELTCTFTPTTSPTLLKVNWFLNNNPDSIQRAASTCISVVEPPSYNIARYDFTCNGNIFKLKILKLENSDKNDCWSCSVSFSSSDPTTGKASACINVTNKDNTNLLLLLLLLLLLPPIPIIIILICCGCLDCCKCCRIYDHYDEKECCYVTCYCLKKGCCSFFFCRPSSERGTLFGGRKSKKERCGGCYSCQEIRGCHWPNFCKHSEMTSCGGCYCICCVEGMTDQDEPFTVQTEMQASPAKNGPDIKTKNKVHPLATKLPPIQGVTSGETVELKEPRKKKKKKNKDKLDLGKSAEE